MKMPEKSSMIEATRLTRQGRIEEAMAVLREALSSSASLTSSARSSRDEFQEEGAPPTLDMLPPSKETGDAWTVPMGAKAGRKSADLAPTQIPAALGGLLNFSRHGSLRAPAANSGQMPSVVRFEERSFANEAGRRNYKLYIPSSYNGQEMPLVIMLHGCTQSPDDFAAGTQMNTVAEELGFLVAYPAQAQSANVSRCWNWFSAAHQKRDHGEPSLLAGITREIMRDFQVQRGRVYIAGLSAGGAAAAIMGHAYPDLYAAIGIHSGLPYGAASDLTSAHAAMRSGASITISTRIGPANIVPTIVFHGDRDSTVNRLNSDRIIVQARMGAQLSTVSSAGVTSSGIRYSRTVHADQMGHTMLEHWVLHGAGHAWSGGSATGSYTDPRGPDASREMIRFFFEQSPGFAAGR